jgi:hypothetical protein
MLLDQNLFRTPAVVADDALFLAFKDLDRICGHLMQRVQADQVDLPHSRHAGGRARHVVFLLAQNRAGDVVSDVAPANRDYLLSQGNALPSTTSRRKSTPPCRVREVRIHKQFEQVAEFVEVVALARFGFALQIRKQFAPSILAGITSELLTDKALQSANRDGLIDIQKAFGEKLFPNHYIPPHCKNTHQRQAPGGRVATLAGHV